MEVVRSSVHDEVLTTAPIFTGTVHRRSLIDEQTSPEVTVTLVRFTNGARTRRHTHSADQILYITEGHGIVASTEHEHRVRPGDIVHVPKGEKHWHGAVVGEDMAHLSILPPCETNVDDER
jgi:quercetin dioxygenase-like cupin family protein